MTSIFFWIFGDYMFISLVRDMKKDAFLICGQDVLYERHYNPRFVYFLPTFRRPFLLFSRRFFRKILSLCMVSIQELLLIKSVLWRTVLYFGFPTWNSNLELTTLRNSAMVWAHHQMVENHSYLCGCRFTVVNKIFFNTCCLLLCWEPVVLNYS